MMLFDFKPHSIKFRLCPCSRLLGSRGECETVISAILFYSILSPSAFNPLYTQCLIIELKCIYLVLQFMCQLNH